MAASRVVAFVSRIQTKHKLFPCSYKWKKLPCMPLTYSRVCCMCSVASENLQKDKAAPKALRFSKQLERISDKSADEYSGKVDFTDEPDVLYRKIMLEIKGHDREVLQSYITYIQTAASLLNIEYGPITVPPKIIQRETMLKSVHIYSKHKMHYEMRTHFKTMDLLRLTGSTADTFLEYIQRNLPEGVAMKVTRVRLEPFPDSLTTEDYGTDSEETDTETTKDLEVMSDHLESQDKLQTDN